jgi:hypothetical protein
MNPEVIPTYGTRTRRFQGDFADQGRDGARQMPSTPFRLAELSCHKIRHLANTAHEMHSLPLKHTFLLFKKWAANHGNFASYVDYVSLFNILIDIAGMAWFLRFP